MIGEAVVDETGKYRYLLSRDWGLFGESNCKVAWIMLNPSTADANIDDPTIRRCKTFSTLWGYDSLVVVNLYALRATNPKHLLETIDPVGERNGDYIRKAIRESQLVVAAWGAFKLGVPGAIRPILHEVNLSCLGTTKDGHPKHPLYVKATTQRQRFSL